MNDVILILPLALLAAGAVAAACFGIPALGPRVGMVTRAWLLAAAPAAAFGILLAGAGHLEVPRALELTWLPSFGLSVGLFLDPLGALFALLVTGIGALVVVYAGYYFKDDPSAWRFLAYLLSFSAAMLGLVLAGDVITLFVFWELTSITSYLLIGYKTKDEAARRGAFMALVITGGGGIALLGGLLMMAQVAGSTALPVILSSGEALRSNWLYPPILALVAFGAFSKSAQVPAHIWLPRAMAAPTPASAYLHSATMVKAGIFLLARLNPALGGTEAWFYLLTLVGGATMIVGAYLGFKQSDLKALLAYTTISQLGVLVMLTGQDTDIAYKALVIGITAHALYKSALFLVAGIVDHATGTRDLRRLGGLWRALPITFVAGSLAALSMAGLPPLFGFLAKETLLATATHPTIPAAFEVLLPLAAVTAGAIMVATAGLLVRETFLGSTKDPTLSVHRPPQGMVVVALVPALLSLVIAALPATGPMATFLSKAAGSAFGGPVKVSLALWTGVHPPLLLSIVAVALGGAIFLGRDRARTAMNRLSGLPRAESLYTGTLAVLDSAAALAVRLQAGRLRDYLAVMLGAVLALVVLALWAAGSPGTWLTALRGPSLEPGGQVPVLRAFAMGVVALAALGTVFVRRDVTAILILGAAGLAVALVMALEPAPDVALVQIVVDVLAIVVLVLAIERLPRAQRRAASRLMFRQSRLSLARDVGLSAGMGLVAGLLTLVALVTRPRPTALTPYFAAEAKPRTGTEDIVGAIVVDFRALDTLLEITVFTLAGLGVYMLLRHAARAAGDRLHVTHRSDWAGGTLGVGGTETSPLLHALAYAVLPLAMVVGAVHIMFGHDQPGDGFTAGVIVSLAIAFWYVVFGYEVTRRRLTWLRPRRLIGLGLGLALLSGLVGPLAGLAFMAPIDVESWIHLPLPSGFHLSRGLLFELAIGLAVLGGASYVLAAMGHLGDGNAPLTAAAATLPGEAQRPSPTTKPLGVPSEEGQPDGIA